MIRNVQPGPARAAAVPLQLERAPVVRPGDVVRWSQKRGRVTKTYFARVSSPGRVAQFSPRSTVWVCFRGVPVRCYDHSVQLGPETEYGVAIGKLATVSRQPLALGRASLAGLRAATPWFTAS